MEKPLTYNKISIEKRKELIEMTSNFKISIAKAARTLQIKNSTAKLIVKRYRQTGTFFQPKRDLNSGNPIQDVDQESSPLPLLDNELASIPTIIEPHRIQNPYFCLDGPLVQNSCYYWTLPWSSFLPNAMGMLYNFI